MGEVESHRGANGSGPNGGGQLSETPFSCQVIRESGCVVASMHGELDLASSAELQRQLLDALAQYDEPLVLDLADVSFLDSSGLAVLYRAQQEAEARGIPMLLRAVPPHAHRVLEVTGMTSLFELEPLDS